MSLIDTLLGTDPRIVHQRRIDPWHTNYVAAVVRAVASGEIPADQRYKLLPIHRTFVGARLAAAGARRDAKNVLEAQQANSIAQPGDTIFFADGVYDFGTDQFSLKSGVTYTGNWSTMPITRDGVSMIVPVCKATLKFTRPEGSTWAESKCFAIVLPNNSAGITVDGLAIRSNHGIFKLQGNHADLIFKHCDLQWADNGGAGYNELAFYGVGVDGLTIEENYFHDSLKSDRNMEIWGASRFSHQFNVFYLINDVGHWMNCTSGKHSNNFGRRIHRMGCEMQQDTYPGPSQSPFEIKGNVFYDWERPYWDSMLMSVPSYSTNILIEENYLRGNAFNLAWGDPDSSGMARGSYGIECPQGPAGGQIVRKNIIGGERMVAQLMRAGGNADCIDNQTFGDAPWSGGKAVGNEPGSATRNGLDQNNTIRPFAQMPLPPAQPRPSGSPTPNPIPTPTPSTMTTKPIAFSSFVRVLCEGVNSGNTVLQWRGGDGVWKDVANKITTLPVTIDVGFNPTAFKNWWLWFRLLDAVGPSAEVKTNLQLGVTADPVINPPQPLALVSITLNIKRSDGTTATYDVPIENGVLNFAKATVK